jgi:hypothetical protein
LHHALRKAVLSDAAHIHKECKDGGVDIVGTMLARVTMAIHGSGNVPDPGGWYFFAMVSGLVPGITAE